MIFMNVPLFSRYKSCAKKTGTRDASRNEARAKLLWRVDTRKGREMSLLGTWQTFGPHPQMSAFGDKADMGITLRNVR
jgi:hypothetical protein